MPTPKQPVNRSALLLLNPDQVDLNQTFGEHTDDVLVWYYHKQRLLTAVYEEAGNGRIDEARMEEQGALAAFAIYLIRDSAYDTEQVLEILQEVIDTVDNEAEVYPTEQRHSELASK